MSKGNVSKSAPAENGQGAPLDDPAFAIQAGAAPADATRDSHGSVRELFKSCALGVQYAM
jgi:hypothetical protein